MEIAKLAEEFPRGAVHWRAQTLTRNGEKALALAYLDARDVMDRLDEVCGPEHWQSEFEETAKGRVICRIGIKIESDWVWKSDGAGNTDVEGEKGGISDALKRAAVHWGIGRYLYRTKAPWVPCKTYENKAGKKVWSEWTEDPWNFVKGSNPSTRGPEGQKPGTPKAGIPKTSRDKADWFLGEIANAKDAGKLHKWFYAEKIQKGLAGLDTPHRAEVEAKQSAKANELDPIMHGDQRVDDGHVAGGFDA